MIELLGASAVSDFRIAKLRPALEAHSSRDRRHQRPLRALRRPRARSRRARNHAARAPADLRSARRRAGSASLRPSTTEIVVVPRFGTISPWSSKATDIAHVCGLDAVRRIERGIVWRIDGAKKLSRDEALRLATPLFDRMTETALLDRGEAARLFVREKTRAVAHRVAGQRTRRARDRELRTRSRAVGRRNRLPGEEFRGARARSHRCRAHDVRAGELRTLPPQDLQRRLDHRRRASAEIAVRDDPQHAREESAGRALRLPRQRRRHGRRARQALLPESRERHLRRDRRAHRHPHEGRDAQPPDRDLAVSGRCHRIGRRDSRRRRHGPRRETESRAHGVLRVASAHSRASSSRGKKRRVRRSANPIASSPRSTS